MEITKKEKYIEAVGRRKTSVARVRMFEAGKNSITVNNNEMESYFPTNELQKTVRSPLESAKLAVKFKISVVVRGGGISSQAQAIRHGISRALVLRDVNVRKTIKSLGYLKRDPRAKERRKFGLKKARKAPQWSKR